MVKLDLFVEPEALVQLQLESTILVSPASAVTPPGLTIAQRRTWSAVAPSLSSCTTLGTSKTRAALPLNTCQAVICLTCSSASAASSRRGRQSTSYSWARCRELITVYKHPHVHTITRRRSHTSTRLESSSAISSSRTFYWTATTTGSASLTLASQSLCRLAAARSPFAAPSSTWVWYTLD